MAIRRFYAALSAAFLLTGCTGTVPAAVPALPCATEQPAEKPSGAASPALPDIAAAWAASVRMLPPPVRVLVLHDHLVRTVTYDVSAPRRHSASGALLDGRAVCDGYAAAFCLLAEAAGIPCLTVTGEKDGIPHAWNLVNPDGTWYHMDCAADDADAGAPLHRFFLLADGAMQGYVWNRTAVPAAEPGSLSYSMIADEMCRE